MKPLNCHNTKYRVILFKHSMASNSAISGIIWSDVELIRDNMFFLVTAKNEEDPIKIKDAKLATILNSNFP